MVIVDSTKPEAPVIVPSSDRFREIEGAVRNVFGDSDNAVVVISDLKNLSRFKTVRAELSGSVTFSVEIGLQYENGESVKIENDKSIYDIPHDKLKEVRRIFKKVCVEEKGSVTCTIFVYNVRDFADMVAERSLERLSGSNA